MPVEARAYPRPLPNPEWLGKLTEEILEPDLPIVDPHHHLWDHPGSRYLLDELLADVNSGPQHRRDRVHPVRLGLSHQRSRGDAADRRKRVRPRDRRGERPARRARPRSAPASSASPICGCQMSMRCSKGRSPPAGGRFRGIRQIAAHDPAIVGASSYVPPPGLMDDPNFRRGLKRLPAHDLTFEAWIYHPQIKTPDRGGARMPGGEDRAQPFRRSARGRPL